MLAALELKTDQVVADIGAGTGYFAIRLARHATAPEVFAANIEPEMVDYLKRRAEEDGLKNVTVIQATAASPNLPEPVNLVLIVNTYHHIGEREEYFRQLASSLKPGGRVAIIDHKEGAPGGPPDHFRFAPEEMQLGLKLAGFELQARHRSLPRHNSLIFRRAPGTLTAQL